MAVRHKRSIRQQRAAARPAPQLERVKPLLLTVAQAAAVLGISRSTLYPLVMAGTIGSLTIGSCRRIPVAEIERFVAAAGTD